MDFLTPRGTFAEKSNLIAYPIFSAEIAKRRWLF